MTFTFRKSFLQKPSLPNIAEIDEELEAFVAQWKRDVGYKRKTRPWWASHGDLPSKVLEEEAKPAKADGGIKRSISLGEENGIGSQKMEISEIAETSTTDMNTDIVDIQTQTDKVEPTSNNDECVNLPLEIEKCHLLSINVANCFEEVSSDCSDSIVGKKEGCNGHQIETHLEEKVSVENRNILTMEKNGIEKRGVVGKEDQEFSDKNEGTVKSSEENEGTVKSSEENEGTVKSSEENEGTVKSSEENEGTVKSSEENEGTMKPCDGNEGTMKSSEENEGTVKFSEENEGTVKSSEENEGTVKSSEENEGTVKSSEENEGTVKSSEENEGTVKPCEGNEGTMKVYNNNITALLNSGRSEHSSQCEETVNNQLREINVATFEQLFTLEVLCESTEGSLPSFEGAVHLEVSGGGVGDGSHVNGGSSSNNNAADTTHHTSRKDDNHHTSQRDPPFFSLPSTVSSSPFGGSKRNRSSLVFEYGDVEQEFQRFRAADSAAAMPPKAPRDASRDIKITPFLSTTERLGFEDEDETSPRSPSVEPSTNTQTTGTTGPTAGPNELFFGTERSTSGSYRDREERLKVLREKQQQERQQKLEELKQHAAAAQRFREQQESQRRQRLQELRSKDQDRRQQVEERRRYMEQAEREKRDQVLKKTHERDQRMETKRRNERSNIVFAFGSSTPRMLDPKENSTYWGSRRSTSTSNVTMDGSSASRRSSDCVDNSAGAPFASTQGGGEALARKRATSAQGLDRNSGEIRMSSSMYEVFHWTDGDGMQTPNSVTSPMTPTQQGDDIMSRSMTSSVARRRTDIQPITPSLRDGSKSGNQRSPGRAVSMSRLDQLSKPRQYPPSPHLLTPVHEKGSGSMSNTSPHSRTRSMTHLAGRGTGGGKPSRPSPPNLNRPMSRSTAALVRSTRAEQLRVKARSQLQGGKSVGATPSGSRPTSALSHASSSTTGGGVAMRPRSAISRRPRPMSIAGTALTSSESRARSPHRTKTFNMSCGSSTSSLRSTNRAKSATSDGSAPATPARTPSTGQRTPKRTPAQVKAESARKSADKTKSTPSPSQSATKKTGNKTTVKDKEEVKSKEEVKNMEEVKSKEEVKTSETTTVVSDSTDDVKPVADDAQVTDTVVESVSATETVTENVSTEVVTSAVETVTEQVVNGAVVEKIEQTTVEVKSEELDSPAIENSDGKTEEPEKVVIEESKPSVTEEKSRSSDTPVEDGQEAGDKKESSGNKPVTGYTSEEEYKAVLAEKRRLAREAKEREAEMERIRLEEEAERERQEEIEMLKLIEEQRKAEEERLQKAIEAAQKEKELEKKRLEEEEKERIEAERIEAEKQKEAEEKLRKEEEERMKRKDRVAAIMARTRKAGSTTPNKSDSNTPNEETKSISEALQKANLTDSMIDTMSDSMIAAATHSEMSCEAVTTSSETDSMQATSGVSSAAPSDFSSQPPSDVSTTHASLTSECSSLEQQTVMQDEIIVTSDSVTNGNVLSDFNGHRSNGGVHNSNGLENNQSANLLGSFDPFTPSTESSTTEFEQIIDAGSAKVKLANEDAMNSNEATPPPPIAAFQENDNSVTDLLL